MDLDDFWDMVNATFLEHLSVNNGDPHNNNRWRWGQTCMNVLRDERPDLYVVITGTENDPWNADVSTSTYQRFVNYVTAAW